MSDPTPSPTPTPQPPVPVPPLVSWLSSALGKLWGEIKVPALLIGAFLLYQHYYGPKPIPSPVVADFVALGREYAPVLASTYATAWDKAATLIEQQKPMSEAQAELQKSWQADRTQAFVEKVAPSLGKIVPEGVEPSPTQRAALAAAFRDFAKGLGEKGK